jgi:hypothetical protein
MTEASTIATAADGADPAAVLLVPVGHVSRVTGRTRAAVPIARSSSTWGPGPQMRDPVRSTSSGLVASVAAPARHPRSARC